LRQSFSVGARWRKACRRRAEFPRAVGKLQRRSMAADGLQTPD
jgi:hypothetical protein